MIQNPELSMGNRMLLQSAISEWFRKGLGRDLRAELQTPAEVGDLALRASFDCEGSFLSSGKEVPFEGTRLENSIDDIQARQDFSEIVQAGLGASDITSVLTFDSMKRGLTVFHSKNYTRAKKRRTYNVAFKNGDETSFGAIVKYYLVRAEDKVLRLVEIEHHETITESPSEPAEPPSSAKLRLRVVPRVESRLTRRRVVHLDAVLNLVVFFPQPETVDPNGNVMVLQLSSTGRF